MLPQGGGAFDTTAWSKGNLCPTASVTLLPNDADHLHTSENYKINHKGMVKICVLLLFSFLVDTRTWNGNN